jgi:hypothetical protein
MLRMLARSRLKCYVNESKNVNMGLEHLKRKMRLLIESWPYEENEIDKAKIIHYLIYHEIFIRKLSN